MKIRALKTLVLPNGRTIAEGDIAENVVGLPAEMQQFVEVVGDGDKEEPKDSGKVKASSGKRK